METRLNEVVFVIGNTPITFAKLLVSGLLSLLFVSIILFFNYWFYNKIRTDNQRENEILKNRTKTYLLIIWGIVYICFRVFGIEYEISLFDTGFTIGIRPIIQIILLFLIANFLDFVLSRLFVQNFYIKTDKNLRERDKIGGKNAGTAASKLVKRLVYLSVLLYLINTFDFNYVLLSYKSFVIDVSGIIVALISIMAIQLLLWVIVHIAMFNYYKRKEIDIGTQFAINQIIKYILYVLTFVVIIDIFGENLTVIWGGLAALLVGVGLGLQQTFNDFFSGFVLLFERSVVVGNIVEVDGIIGRVKQIGLRTSTLQTRDGLNLIVPNSKIANDNVVNWDHDDDIARFTITVGVAYGSDTLLVKKLLLESANEHGDVLEFPKANVLFDDFDDSSLKFLLTFWSTNLFYIENVKSEIRFTIDNKFRTNNIVIPFPQRSIWFKNSPDFEINSNENKDI